ncbi:ribonuclease HI family protein [Candidatus Uhrbacteria bacterium]|nr:ribonuclease HI family protein [Candidatus Uhrbacteria bacterium]
MKALIHTDGGARGNPGPAGIGGVILDSTTGKEIEYSQYIGIATNNQAEYRSLLHALLIAQKLKARSVICYLDSELIVKQLNGEYRVKNRILGQIFHQVRDLATLFESAQFIHIRRELNKHADRLVNSAIDSHIRLTEA